MRGARGCSSRGVQAEGTGPKCGADMSRFRGLITSSNGLPACRDRSSLPPMDVKQWFWESAANSWETRKLGARGFRYCGSLLGPAAILFPDQRELAGVAGRLASAVTKEFEVRGLNGIDFIAADGVPIPIEVNPRYSASMELLERGQALSIFRGHEQACRGTLPKPIQTAPVLGKAIVFARRNVVMGDTRSWLEDTSLADIPHPGERIQRGRPICTVFAGGNDAESCYEGLVSRAAAVYQETESRRSAA